LTGEQSKNIHDLFSFLEVDMLGFIGTVLFVMAAVSAALSLRDCLSGAAEQ
jgi:hypothetical protein